MDNLELVYFELNNWFSGRDYPNEEPFISWIRQNTFSNDEWCKDNKIVVRYGNVDMSVNWCIIATKDWVEENCPALLSGKKYTYKTIAYGRDTVKEQIHDVCMSDFLRYPDEYGDVTGRFGWNFPEYTEENFGCTFYYEPDDEIEIYDVREVYDES